MVQMCKMKISPGVFFNFKILILKDCQGAERAKNGPKWQKFLSVASYISGTIYHMIFIHGTHLSFICKTIISPGIFFIFFFFFFSKFWFSGSLGGEGMVKGQKMAQNDKQFCLSHSVSQELYIMWLWFLVHMCKMMISPAIFVISQNFDFCSFLRGIKGQKISVCFALYLRSCRSYHQDFDSDIYRCFYLFF